jgi:hypothetical protein
MKLIDLTQEAFCNTSDQGELCEIAYDLVRGELSKEQAAIKILEYVEGMSQRLPCIISESIKVSQ